MKLTEGKRKGLEAVATKNGPVGKVGVIAAAAMDQRGPLLQAIAQNR